MSPVTQKHDFGCGAACVAMLAGVSYDRVALRAAPHDFNEDGLQALELHSLLRKFGIRSARRLSSLAGSRPHRALAGQRAIIRVNNRQKAKAWHWVVWDGVQVVDPARKPYQRYRYHSYLRLL